MLRFPYTQSEVECLVENYLELYELKRKKFIHLRLLDLQVAIKRLPIVLGQAVVLFGIYGNNLDTVAELLDVSESTVIRRYANGLELLAKRMK